MLAIAMHQSTHIYPNFKIPLLFRSEALLPQTHPGRGIQIHRLAVRWAKEDSHDLLVAHFLFDNYMQGQPMIPKANNTALPRPTTSPSSYEVQGFARGPLVCDFHV